VNRYLSLYQLADQAAFEKLQGKGEVSLEGPSSLSAHFAQGTPVSEEQVLLGELVGGHGLPSEGGKLWAVLQPSGQLLPGNLSQDGHFQVSNLPPGRVDLFFSWSPTPGVWMRLDLEAVPIPSPPLTIQLPPRQAGGKLQGEPRTTLRISSANLDGVKTGHLQVSASLKVPSDGHILLPKLPAGEYALGLEVPGSRPGSPGFLSLPVPEGDQYSPPFLGNPPQPFDLRVPGAQGFGLINLLRGTVQEFPGDRTPEAALLPGAFLLFHKDTQGTRWVYQQGRERLEGRLALLGTTMEADQDAYPTPVYFGQERDMPGVEIHAHALSNLLSGRQLQPQGPLVGLAAGILLLGLIGLVFQTLSPFKALAAGCFLLLGYLGLAAWLLAVPGWILPTAPNLLAAILFAALELTRYLRGARQEKAHIMQVFGKCVDPVLRDRMLNSPDLVLAGECRIVTVLFSDIRGFTTLSEKLSPQELLAVLNEYFGRVTPVFLSHGGVFDKYIGDAFMGFFGAPLEQPDHAQRAVRAATAMLDEHARWKQQREEQGLPAFNVGFGINTGEAIAGAVGSVESRINYSVLGDAVNVAARLESLCKEHKAVLLISGATHKRLEGEFPAEDLGEIHVKGRAEAVRVKKLR
jgi:class 3 adenylate cyclase